MMIGNTEMMQDGDKTIFMGPAGCGKTRSMLVTAQEALANGILNCDLPAECKVYALDPVGDIRTALSLNIDNLALGFLRVIQVVTNLTDLPRNMGDAILLIDDGRGWYSLVENESHLKCDPILTFSTVQIRRSSIL